MTGVVTACGGGLLRDVLVRDEPLLFKPGQLYVLAALIGASLFTLLILFFNLRRTGGPDCHWLLFCFSDSGYRLQLEDSFGVARFLRASVSGEI